MDVNSLLNEAPVASQAQSNNNNNSNEHSSAYNARPLGQPLQLSQHSTSPADAPVLLSSPLPNSPTRLSRVSNRPSDIHIENGILPAIQAPLASPHVPKQPSKLSLPPQMAEQETVTYLDEVKLSPEEYIVPMSVPSRAYDHYLDIIASNRDEHRNLMREQDPSATTIQAMEKMIVKLDNVITHPDMVDETTSTDTIYADGGDFHYTRISSHKFGFLYHFLDMLYRNVTTGIPDALTNNLKDSTQLRVAIVVENGKLLEILVTFLTLMNIAFTTVDDGEQYHEDKQGPLQVFVVSSSFDELSALPSVDIIYAMDSSFDRRGDLAKTLKGSEDSNTVVLFPWSYASPEHVRACMPKLQSPLDTLRMFTQIIIQARPEIGSNKVMLQDDLEYRVDTAGYIVGQWFLGGCSSSFPFRSFEPIRLVGLELGVKSNKRQLDDINEDDSESPSKRRRTSEEVPPNNSSRSTPDRELELQNRVEALQEQLKTKTTALEQSQASLDMVRADLAKKTQKHEEEAETNRGLMMACDNTMNWYQDERDKMKKLGLENARLESMLEAQKKLIERHKNEVAEFRTEIRELKQTKAQSLVDGAMATDLPTDVNSSLPLLAKIEEQEKEITSLKKKAKSAEDNRAYAFHLYQEASTKAVELAGELREKEAEIERLIPLAENHSQVALQAADQSELETLRFGIDRLTVEKAELEEQLRRGNSRPGMSTRGQSTPGTNRSPRRNAGSPPPRSRATSRQPSSRTTSPTGRGVVGSGGSRRAGGLPGRLAEG